MLGGIIKGIAKVFAPVGNAAVRVGKAVSGVGAATFTAGAATGAKSIASGGLNNVASSMGRGVLGNVLNGAIRQAAVGAVIGGGIGAVTGQGFAKGAKVGGLGGALTGGLGGAMQGNGLMAAASAPAAEAGIASAQTATGVTPTGVTKSTPMALRGGTAAMPGAVHENLAARLGEQGNGLLSGASAAAPAAGGAGNGLMSFLSSETGGNVIAGLGQGAMGYMQAQEAKENRKLQAEEYDKQRAFDLDKEMRVRDSYKMGEGAYFTPPAPDDTPRPTPAQAYGRTRRKYDPAQGRIVTVPA